MIDGNFPVLVLAKLCNTTWSHREFPRDGDKATIEANPKKG